MFISALQALSQHAATVLAVGILTGLALPDLAGWMRPLLPSAGAGLLFLALAVQDPQRVLQFIVVAFAANILLQLLGTGVAVAMGRRSALTVGFASGNRNMGLLLAVLPADSPPDVLLFFVLAQLPIYILPAVLGPAYRRWLP